MQFQSQFYLMGIVVSLLLSLGCRAKDSSPVSEPESELSRPKSVTSVEEHKSSPSQRAYQPGDWFEDVTKTTNVDFVYTTGRDAQLNTILETVGGGVGLFDFDKDSFADLFVVGGGTIDHKTGFPHGVQSRLFRNSSNWKFTNVTDSGMIPSETGYSHGCLSSDFDSDGFPDLLLTCYGKCTLLLNAGDGTFLDATEDSGLDTTSWHTAAAAGDINGDGLLDLYIANYVDWTPNPTEICRRGAGKPADVCPPQKYSAVADELYLNSGNGQFENISEQANISSTGKGLGVISTDWNGDGLIDFYVANDVVRNELYHGGRSLPLREVGEVSGVAYNEAGTPEGSMGGDTADVNGDGLPDLWVTNFELEDNSLFLNIGDGLFQHATTQFGLAGSSRDNVGFGTGFHDFDSDGWPDLYVLNGHVQYHRSGRPFRQPAVLYRNQQGQRFEEITDQAGAWFLASHTARGAAVGDIDNDGALDLVISSLDESVTILRNKNNPENWLRVQLCGTESSRESVGARVIVNALGRERTFFQKSGAGYLSQSDARLLIPVEAAKIKVDLCVKWSAGTTEWFRDLTCKIDHVLVEGQGSATQADED